MSDSAYITHDQFNPSNLGGSTPKKTEFTNSDGQAIKFFELALHYNYGTPDKPLVTDFFVELPKMKARGIKLKEEPKKNRKGEDYIKKVYSQLMTFELSDPESQQTIQSINKIYSACAQLLGQTPWAKGKHFSIENPKSLFVDPIYWPIDEVTNEPIEGKNPCMWLKLKGGYNKTLFIDLDGNPIDWALLNNVNLEFIPLIHFTDIYMAGNGQARFRPYLSSAIVLKIEEAGTSTRQVSTLERLKAKYGAQYQQQKSQVEEALARLTTERQDQLMAQSMDSPPVPTNSADLDASSGEMSSIPQQQSEGNISDFLSSAPAPQVSLPTQSEPIKLAVNPNAQRVQLNIS